MNAKIFPAVITMNNVNTGTEGIFNPMKQLKCSEYCIFLDFKKYVQDIQEASPIKEKKNPLEIIDAVQTSECTKLKNTPDLLFKLTGKAHHLCLNKIQVSQWKLTCELSKDGNKVSETAVKG